MTDRHFICLDAARGRVWIRSSPSQTYVAATPGHDLQWHRTPRGPLAVYEVPSALARQVRAAIASRLAGTDRLYSSGPSHAWAALADVPAALRADLEALTTTEGAA